MGWVSTPRPGCFTPGKDPVPIVQEAGWGSQPGWTGAENLAPTGIRSPDRPTRSESLYRLSYPGSPPAVLAPGKIAHNHGTEGCVGPAWTGAKRKFFPPQCSNPDRPTCRHSLYLLRCPALFEILMEFIMMFGMCVKLPMESSSTG